MRLIRLLNALRVARYSRTVRLFGRVFWAKRNELQVALFLNLLLILLSSTVIYIVEHDHQPGTFSSIPAAMWWAAITLTTVGYGDVYPVSPLGKFFAILLAFFGIGLFALPASILASGFLQEALSPAPQDGVCPTCRRPLEDETAAGLDSVAGPPGAHDEVK
jgi:voltage-gated potassium channel